MSLRSRVNEHHVIAAILTCPRSNALALGGMQSTSLEHWNHTKLLFLKFWLNLKTLVALATFYINKVKKVSMEPRRFTLCCYSEVFYLNL